jgi:hypothetical protein
MKIKRGTIREDGMVFVEYRKRKCGTSEYWTTKSIFELLLQRQRKRKANNWFKLKYQNDLVFRKKHNDKKNQARRIKYKNDELFRKKLNDCSVRYSKKRRDNNTLFKLIDNVRSLIRSSFKRTKFNKNSKTIQILGCTIRELKSHIQSQFKQGMSWDNRNEWHIDHIMPVSMAKTEDEVVRLNHYKNLRPLWAHENRFKSDNTPEILVLF